MTFNSVVRSVLSVTVVAFIAFNGIAMSNDESRLAGSKSPDRQISFETDILPLFKSKCWECHGTDVQKGALSLRTPALIQKGGESGPVIVVGQSAASRLFEVVEHGEMPPDPRPKLTAAEAELISHWINAGASFGSTTADVREVTQHDVIPILLLRCTACHGRHRREGDLDLRTTEAMLRGGKSGPAFVRGRPADSLMLKRIRAQEMPPHGQLTEVSVKPMEPEELKLLTRWIESRAPAATDEPDLAGTAADPLVRPEDKDFWSFRPPQYPVVPSAGGLQSVKSPIDVFIAQQLQEQTLLLANPADRSTLLRRVTYDLIGLPPAKSDVQLFLADERPDAFERVVDRLLASPRYGERWARHWLDVAGYADCEGRREQHLPRPFAWRYRDYVIQSFNSDKPYDRFLLEQIAGDELADYEHAAEISPQQADNLIATAFLRMAPDPTWANLTGFVPDRLEVTSDSIDVLTAGIMGLTFKCARCHTHKFDPIPQRDYYRLVAIFKGAYDEHDWLKPQIIAYGGALSAGIGERLLPQVSSVERQQWQRHEELITQELAALANAPKTPELAQRVQMLEAQRQSEPKIMALWDRGEPSPTYIYRRGNHATPGAFVRPGVPAALTDPTQGFNISPPYPHAKATGRRLAFARWLTTAENPLTARVMMNRIWKHHFGQGIVRSLGNFGKMGDRPTHPELLDLLAVDFTRRDWGIKAMHRQLVLTAAYQQQSTFTERTRGTDPDNRLLSRMPLGRLDAEQLRDTLFWVADELKDVGGGPAEPVNVRGDGLVTTGNRRSIYVQQLRKHPPSLLESFDLPAMNPNCQQRSDSLVPTQALHLWNDSQVRLLANRFADHVLRRVDGLSNAESTCEDLQVAEIYWIALARAPRPEERTSCVTALRELQAIWLKHNPASDESARLLSQRQALTTLCHTILNSADFLFID